MKYELAYFVYSWCYLILQIAVVCLVYFLLRFVSGLTLAEMTEEQKAEINRLYNIMY